MKDIKSCSVKVCLRKIFKDLCDKDWNEKEKNYNKLKNIKDYIKIIIIIKIKK